MNVRFLTYNVLYGKAVADLEKLIDRHKPDIVCLQEVETTDSSFGKFEKMGYSLADYSNSFIKFGKIYGIATFYNQKKLTFNESSVIDLPRSVYEMMLFILRGGNRPRTLLDTVFTSKKNSKKIRVFNTHLTTIAFNGSRMKQLKETLEDIPTPDGSAFILTGDFNYMPYARRKLEKLLQSYNLVEATKNIDFTLQYSSDGKLEDYNVFQRLGIRLLSKVFTNKVKVDYIFYRNLKLRETQRINTKTSDHFPILSEFTL